MRAVPLTRNASPTPGIKNSSATRGSATMFLSVSARLLPRRSGSSSVFESATATDPGPSPRGLTSRPPGPALAMAQNGDAATRAA
jgi:hypothetical protein